MFFYALLTSHPYLCPKQKVGLRKIAGDGDDSFGESPTGGTAQRCA